MVVGMPCLEQLAPVTQPTPVVFSFEPLAGQPILRLRVRNTFLEFRDDEEEQEPDPTCGRHGCRRSASAPAVLAKAWRSGLKPDGGGSLEVPAQAQKLAAFEQASCMEKIQGRKPMFHKLGAPNFGGGLQQFQICQAPAQSAQAVELPGASMAAPQVPVPMAKSEAEPIVDEHPPEAEATLCGRSTRSQRRRRARHSAASNDQTSLRASREADENSEENGAVTVMVRHIACSYTHQHVVALLGDLGFMDKVNFVHLPLNSKRTANLGYFFVHFSAPEYVEEFRDKIEGKVFGPSRTNKKCEVTIAHMQGDAHLERPFGRGRNAA